MKASFLLAAVLLAGLPLAANATTPPQQRGQAAETKPVNTQQERMRKCNADAGAKKLAGDARKTFMSSCLKAS